MADYMYDKNGKVIIFTDNEVAIYSDPSGPIVLDIATAKAIAKAYKGYKRAGN